MDELLMSYLNMSNFVNHGDGQATMLTKYS